MPAVTVIVPTLNEAGNIEPLVERLSAAFGSRDDWEVLFVDDDSSDGTGTEIRRAETRHPVRLIVREGERGLASAVLRGIASTHAPVVVVMDSDLSHPPEVAPKLAEAVAAGADVAIGSRYVPGGGTEGWSKVRLFLSRGAAMLSRGLTPARDPGAGFFALRRSLLDGTDLKVEGFKILLEILAKLRPAKVVEVPIHFAPRHLGKSKVAAGTAIAYLKQLAKLYAARPAAHVVALIAVLFALKVAIGSVLELDSIEAYHWLYAQHPALGYYDHPGMIGWLIWLSTGIFGDSPLAVRLPMIAGGSLAIWFVFLAARRLYDERTGRLAAFIFGIAFGTLKFTTEAGPDAPLLLFWVMTLWALSHALAGGRTRWWTASGALLGLAMLSKYTAVFLPAGVFLFLILSPEHRPWLRRKEPYLAVLLALLVFSPTLVWNAQNGWRSLVYQSAGRLQSAGDADTRYLIAFVRRQGQLMTPFVALWAWGLGLMALAPWRRVAWPDRLLSCIGMPMLLFFGALAFGRSVRGHWMLPGGATLFLLVAAAVVRGGKVGKWLVGGSVAVCLAGLLLLSAVFLAGPRSGLDGWRELSRAVDRLQPDFVIAQDYHVAAHMAYHLRPRASVDMTAVEWGGKSFTFWWRGAEYAGRDAVIVYEKKEYPESLEFFRRCFDSIGEPVEVEIRRYRARKPEAFLLLRARGYRPPR